MLQWGLATTWTNWHHYAYTYSNINAAFVFVKVCLEYMEGKNHLITNLLFEFYEILYK